jgi:hypothetical protein
VGEPESDKAGNFEGIVVLYNPPRYDPSLYAQRNFCPVWFGVYFRDHGADDFMHRRPDRTRVASQFRRQRKAEVVPQRKWNHIRSYNKANIISRCVPLVYNTQPRFKPKLLRYILRYHTFEYNRQVSPALQFTDKLLSVGYLSVDDYAFSDRFDTYSHRPRNFFHGPGSPRGLSYGSLNIGHLLSTSRSGFRQLLLHQVGLAIDLPKSSIRGINAAPTDYYQKTSKNRYGDCGAYRPSINLSFVIFIGLTLGGFLWSVFVPFWIDDKRRILRTSAVCFGLELSEGGILFFIASGFFPYTWGLPPNWIPERWNPCKQSQSQQEPAHVVNVSQKVLTISLFSYYNNYMANALSTDKQIEIIAALCEGSSIRSIERITSVHRDTIMRLAWIHQTDDPVHPKRHVTVLHIPPVVSPRTAVQAVIVQEFREHGKTN